MSFSSSFCEDSPEPEMSGLCVKLETQFMDDLSKAEAMRVYARVRPMLNSEVEAGYKECIAPVDEQTIRAVVPSSSVRYKSNSNLGQGIIEDFKFTYAYGPDVGQFVFFEETMMNTMQNFIEGQNSLVFSYGITGSGKTFTLQGNPNNPGIIPLSLHLFFASVENQLLDKIVVKPDKFDDVKILNDNEAKKERQLLEQLITAHNQEEWNFRNSSSKSLAMLLCETFSDKFVSDGLETTLGVEEMAQAQAAALMKELGKKSAQQQSGYCSIWVSFAEIYNEHVYDLLQPNINQRTKLLLGEDKNGDVYVKGLTEVCVFNSFEALNILNFGQKNLKIASTKLNYQSSRSHCIFTIKVVRIPDPENITYAKVSRLSFCDLAGSERAAKSQTSGMRLKEAGCINTSLLVLGRCLEQLRINPSPRDRKRIPFRESKLTRLFSGFFTGKGKAVMITNASPSEVTFDETLHALRFSAVATELIINDSYIATASNTLQTITSMWTKANVSMSSEKSISFEDSTLEALQEKDELIEKLLDLAESLTKNLEKEKKERAELEIRIRREVCQEYSEYSDELLERQKKIYEEEKESIREIYKKRIAAMEKMYENIIQAESDGSDSSGEEEYEDAKTESDVIMRNKRKSSINKKSCKDKTDETDVRETSSKDNLMLEGYIQDIEALKADMLSISDELNGTKEELEKSKEYCIALETDVKKTSSKENLMLEGYIQDIEALKADLLSISDELKSTKEELEKSKEYCIALETATEEMERKLEISNINLEKALSENGELKIKVDYLQASHQDSLKKETDVSMLSDYESLKNKYDDLKALLENTLNSNEILKTELDALKIDCVSYKCDNDDLFKKKNVLEEQLQSLSKDFESTKVEKEDLYQKLVESEEKVASLKNEIKVLENKINELVKSHEESKECLESSLENAKDELKKVEEVLKSVNEDYDQLVLKSADEKRKLNTLETDYASVKEEMAQTVKKNEVLEEKYVSVSDELKSIKSEKEGAYEKLIESQKQVTNLKDEIEMLEKKINELVKSQEESKEEYESSLKNAKDDLVKAEEALKSVNQAYEETLLNIENEKQKLNALESECSSIKEEMAEVMKKNQLLEEKYASISEDFKSEKLASAEEIEIISNKLSEALSALDKEKEELQHLKNTIDSQEKDLARLQKENQDLLNNRDSKIESDKLACKEELDAVLGKLSEASFNLEEQKRKAEHLRNIMISYEIDIAELQKENKELKDKIKSKIELEELACKKELETVVSELEKTSSALDEEKKKIENMTSVIISYEKEMADLQGQYEELQLSINSKNESEVLSDKEELGSAAKKLSDALSELCEEKKKVDDLSNAVASYQKEIAELQKQNFELQDVAKFKNESETLACQKELENVNNKLLEAVSSLDAQKKELENLTNTINVDKLEIAELQKQNVELQQKVTEIESEKLECQKELENASNKLTEALSTLDVQKSELENLTNTINTDKLEIAELQNQKFELQQKLNIEIESKSNCAEQEIEPVSDKLNEILTTVDELAKMQIENESAQNKITELLKIEEELKKEINSKNLHADTLSELLLVLEKRELQATKKVDMLMLDFGKLNETIKKLEAQLKENEDQYETECNRLKEMIKVLQKCELFATNKTKELHKSSITHVEQIMDLEKCVKQRDASIECLKNDNNLLQKQLKNLQDTSKKQLQAQKQQFTAEISNIKFEKSALEKGNKDLKEQVTKLTTEIGKLQSEVKNIKAKFDEVTENKNMLEATKENLEKEVEGLKSQLNDQAERKLVQNDDKSSKNDAEETTSEGIAEKRLRTQNRKVQNDDKSSKNDAEETTNEGIAEKRLRTQNRKNNVEIPVEQKLPEKRALRKKGKTTVEEKSEAKPIKKNEKRKVQMETKSPEIKQVKKTEREKTLVEKKSPEVKPVKKFERGKAQVEKKSPEMKPVKEDEKNETGITEKPERKLSKKAKDQDEKKKSKSKKKVGDKKSKTLIYEETDENINIENTPKMKNVSGRQLKSVENVTPYLSLANSKDLNLARTKDLKRKGLNDSFEDILKEKQTMKKVKFQDIENNLNLKKPQNLRVQLLKATNALNDIPMPSPRMTRGRKRLFNLDTKENTLLTKRNIKTVRS